MFKTEIKVIFIDTRQGCYAGRATLDIELPFVPSKEIALEHPVWDAAKAPVTISYDTDTGRFAVSLPPEERDSDDEIRLAKDNYVTMGWTVDE